MHVFNNIYGNQEGSKIVCLKTTQSLIHNQNSKLISIQTNFNFGEPE